jgi:glycosyltransferase involved in cell wall biosynthesis
VRIAHVTATFPPYRGGTGNVCFHHARELARRGHSITVLTAALPGAPAYEQRDEIAIRRLRPLARIGNAPLLPTLLPALRGFDVIHLHYPFILGAEIVRLAAALTSTPLVLSFHNDLIGDGARAQLFAHYQRLSARITVRGAARLCVVSGDHYAASVLRRSLRPERPPVVELPNGVDLDRFQPDQTADAVRARYGIPGDARLLLFVAALDRAHHFKGLSTLLQALARLPQSIRLLAVGDGDLRPSYEREVAALGLTGRVTFAGALDHAATAPLFSAADVTVLPSTPPESFGLVLVESLACATPVIASNIPGVRTVVQHGRDGLLVPPGDPAALADAIEQITSDDAARAYMGRHGRARVTERYDWRQIAAQLERLYHELLEVAPGDDALIVRGRP